MRSILVVLVGSLVLGGCAVRSSRITAPNLAQALAANPERYVVVDVRSDREWNGVRGYIEGASHIAWPGVKERAGEIEAGPDQEVILVCFTGHRSRWAMDAVSEAVDVPVRDLKGGMMAWWRRDFPVVVEESAE